MNKWQKAMEWFDNAQEGNAEHDSYIYMMANLGIGNVHLEFGKFETARLYYEEALSIARDMNESTMLGTLCNNLGIIASIQGNILAAIANYSKGIPFHQQIGDLLGLARLYNNIGMAYADEQIREKAVDFYRKSLEITAQLEARTLRSITLPQSGAGTDLL